MSVRAVMGDRDDIFKIVTRRREIPVTADITLSVGDSVLPEQPVATAQVLPGKLWRVDVSEALSVKRTEVPSRPMKSPGERVAKDEVIAVGGTYFSRNVVRSPATASLGIVSKTQGVVYVREDLALGSQESPLKVPVAKLLGVPSWTIAVFKKEDISVGTVVTKDQALASRPGKNLKTIMVTSPVYGRISAISFSRGTITISPLFKSQSITAFLKGKVVQVVPGENVEIAGRAAVVHDIWGMGGEGCGRLHFVEGDLTENLDLPGDSVVVAKGTASVAGLERARTCGVRAVVLRCLSSVRVMDFAGGVKNMGITGDEDIPFPLILIEGFRPGPCVSDVFRILRRFQGLICSVRGATQYKGRGTAARNPGVPGRREG